MSNKLKIICKLDKDERVQYYVNENGCYHCISHSMRPHDGYLQISVNSKMIKMHKHIFTIYHGEAEKGKSIMHVCDNRSCVNPNHFSLGTHQENMKHKEGKFQTYKSPNRINDDQRRDIYNNIDNQTAMELCDRWNISYETLKRVRRKGKAGLL